MAQTLAAVYIYIYISTLRLKSNNDNIRYFNYLAENCQVFWRGFGRGVL